jgi:tetratricopeptide (TPR) repeat protein
MTNPLEENLISRTEQSMEQGKGEHALETAEELASIDPKDAIVWYVKGRAHYSAGQFEDALVAFSQAATIKNDIPQVWLLMGYTLIALRRYEESLSSLEYVKSVEPENIEATCALAAVHCILNHASEAKQYVEQARKSNPSAAAKILEGFHDSFFSKSAQVEAPTKAMIERLLHGLKLQ